jgi:hypothetical protein
MYRVGLIEFVAETTNTSRVVICQTAPVARGALNCSVYDRLGVASQALHSGSNGALIDWVRVNCGTELQREG